MDVFMRPPYWVRSSYTLGASAARRKGGPWGWGGTGEARGATAERMVHSGPRGGNNSNFDF